MASPTDSVNAARLLDSAVRLFAHKGYGATSTREIVEAAGVTKPMLYYYFQSKEGLLAAALDYFLEKFHERLRSVVTERRPSREQLVEMVWAQLDFCQEHKPLARLFYALYFGPDDQKHLVDLDKHAQTGHDLLTQSVEQAIESGLVRGDCQEELVMAVHGMINIWVISALNEEAVLDHGLAERVVDNLLRGFQSIEA